jgi:predicted acyltransferase
MQKVLSMTIAGVALMLVGQLWNLTFPINKILWSSSFVCWVGGLSLLLLALFYLVIDVWKLRKWAFFFVVIGVNPITIYLANRIIGWEDANAFIVGGIANLFPETWAPLIMAIGYVMIGWIFLYFLYRKRIFLKV